MMRDERVFGVAGGLGVVEITFVIGLEAHRKFVEVLGDLMVVIKTLNKVDGFVAISVVKLGELVTAGDVDFVIYDLEAERLEEAGADAFPGKSAFELINSFYDPDVSHPGADGSAFAIGVEVEAAGAHPGLVWIKIGARDGESVDGEGARLIASLDLGSDSGRSRESRLFA